MKNIVGYTVFYLKNIDNSIVAGQKNIPLDMKASYEQFIISIGNKMPSEDEFNQWYSSQK